MSYDLPVRLIFIIGMPSGGTSATAGTLFHNGFWCSNDKPSFEPKELYMFFGKELYRGKWVFDQPQTRVSEFIINKFGRACYEYKKEAQLRGFDKAVIKIPGMSIWVPQLLATENSLGVKVEPLLVYRDPVKNGLSIEKRFPQIQYPMRVAKKGQDEILRLHETYGWNMWKFGKDASIKELEDLLGIPLPNKYFDPDIVRQ